MDHRGRCDRALAVAWHAAGALTTDHPLTRRTPASCRSEPVPPARVVSSHRGGGYTRLVAGVPGDPRPGSARSVDPDVCTAREVRCRTSRRELPSHVDEQDLVSYGLLGLISAIERFDPDREIKFETYAISRIKGAIIDELRSLDWVPRSVRTRAREIERAIAELERKLMRAPDGRGDRHQGRHHRRRARGRASTEISRSSIAALDELWSPSSGERRSDRPDRHDRGHERPDPVVRSSRRR